MDPLCNPMPGFTKVLPIIEELTKQLFLKYDLHREALEIHTCGHHIYTISFLGIMIYDSDNDNRKITFEDEDHSVYEPLDLYLLARIADIVDKVSKISLIL